MLKLLFCLTQLNRGTEPKNEREHAAVSIRFSKSNGVELGPTLTDWTLISYIWAIPVSSPHQRNKSSPDVQLWHLWVWRSGEKVQTHSQVSVLCVKLLFREGQGQTVKCSFRAISAHTHSPAILPSVFFREHVSIWQTPLFFFSFFGLANSSGRCGPRSFWEDAKRFRLDAGDAAATASL